jgi:hypothetical protein
MCVAAVLRGEALSAEQWAAFGAFQLVALAAFLHGRFLELALLVLEDERRPATEVRASLWEHIREKEHETVLVAAIRSSARAVEFIPELERNRRAARAVSGALIVRAGFDAPAPLAMELARSLLSAEFVNDMLEKTPEIDRLHDYGSTNDPRDLRQDAIVSAAAAYKASWDRHAPGSRTLPPFPGMPPAIAAATTGVALETCRSLPHGVGMGGERPGSQFFSTIRPRCPRPRDKPAAPRGTDATLRSAVAPARVPPSVPRCCNKGRKWRSSATKEPRPRPRRIFRPAAQPTLLIGQPCGTRHATCCGTRLSAGVTEGAACSKRSPRGPVSKRAHDRLALAVPLRSIGLGR